MAAVTSGRNAIPSKVSRNWATFSVMGRSALVTAVPAASRKVKYSALPTDRPDASSSENPASSTTSSRPNSAPSLWPNSIRAPRATARSGWRRRRARQVEPRRAVGHGQHQVGRVILAGQQAGGLPEPGRDGQPADHVLAVGVLAAGHVQGPAGHPHVGRHRLAERGGHERRRGHGRAGQHRAVAEEGPDPLAQAGVEDRHDQPEVRVDLGGPQRGVEVAEVVLAEQGQRPGRLHVGRGERMLRRARCAR